MHSGLFGIGLVTGGGAAQVNVVGVQEDVVVEGYAVGYLAALLHALDHGVVNGDGIGSGERKILLGLYAATELFHGLVVGEAPAAYRAQMGGM